MTDTPALVRRLRDLANSHVGWSYDSHVLRQAADTLVALSIDGPALRVSAEAAEQAMVQLRNVVADTINELRSGGAISKQFGTPAADAELLFGWADQLEVPLKALAR